MSALYDVEPNESLYAEIAQISTLASIAVHEALAAQSHEAAAETLKEIRRLSTLAMLSARDGWTKATKVAKTYERHLDVAEGRVRAALRELAKFNVDGDFDPHGCFVYVLWGSNPDVPLYVGQSMNVLARLGSHLMPSNFGGSVRRVSLIRCKNERQMMETEGRLIAEYQPPHNVRGITVAPTN